MVDRIAVMKAGRVEQFDAPQVIYNDPKTLFVAEFIGRINRVPGRLVGRESGRSLVRLEGHEDVCPARDNAGIDLGDSIVAALRPEKIDLLAPGAKPTGYAGMFEGRVSEVIFTGEKISVFLETACGPLTVAAQNRLGDGLTLTAGENVKVGWRATDMLVFPAVQ